MNKSQTLKSVLVTSIFAVVLLAPMTVLSKEFDAASYFLPKIGSVYSYRGVELPDRKPIGTRTLVCSSLYDAGDVLGITCKRETYHGEKKANRTNNYYTLNQSVYFSKTKETASGLQEYAVRRIALIIPYQGTDAVWSYSDKDGRHGSRSSFIEMVKTPAGEFVDVVLDTETSHPDGGGRIVIKKYYARGYGLVKEEHITKDSAVSFELESID